MSWRSHSKEVICKVMYEHRNAPLDVLKRALHDAYPFGQREYHPYKIWCSEQRKALAMREQQISGYVPGELWDGAE